MAEVITAKVSSQKELEEALINEKKSIILLTKDISIDKQLVVNRDGITIDGQNYKITITVDLGEDNSTKHALNIFSDNVTIKNLTMDNGNKSYGVQAFLAKDVVLEDITILNSKGAGLTVNGSEIAAADLNTKENKWGSVNVDPGKNVKKATVFKLTGEGQLEEENQIWSDGGNVTENTTVTVTAEGYSEYYYAENSRFWTNRELENTATITRDNKTYTFYTIQEAIDAAEKGNTIKLNSDVTLESQGLTIGTDQEITLDLAGYKLSGVFKEAKASALISNNGSLTIDNTSTNKTGIISYLAEQPDLNYGYGTHTISNQGALIIKGGQIENITGDGASYSIDNNSGNRKAVVTINGGYIVNPNGNFAIRQFANSTTNMNSVVINNGKVEGTRAVWIHLPGSSGQEKLAELTVNGGTLKSTDKGGSNLAVYSYTFGDSFAKTKITITGGTFDGDVALTGGNPKTPMETVEVSDEAVFLGQRGVFSYAKIVNETQYKSYNTIEEAIAAATSYDTILLRGTIGTEENYEIYTVPNETNDLTIKGIEGNKVYGTFIVKGNNVTIDGLVIENKGDLKVNGRSAHSGGIYVYAESAKIINNTLINGLEDNAEGVNNAIQIMSPKKSSLGKYVLSGNTIKRYNNKWGSWDSGGIIVVQGYTTSSVDGYCETISAVSEDYKKILEDNIFESTTVYLGHQDWKREGGATIYSYPTDYKE